MSELICVLRKQIDYLRKQIDYLRKQIDYLRKQIDYLRIQIQNHLACLVHLCKMYLFLPEAVSNRHSIP